MKISKKRLKRIIKEERAKLLKEGEQVKRASIGFSGFTPNRNPDFAKAYGKDAKVMGRYRNNNKDLREQPMPAPSSDPVETAFQELKFSGAYKELQETLHESYLDLNDLFNEHSDKMLQADQGSLLDDLQEVMANLDNLRQTFHALR